MIVRGNPEDLQSNRSGQLSPAQTERLAALKPFRLPIVPSLLFGALLIVYGLVRRDPPGWITLAMGVVLIGSAWSRYRQQAALKSGAVDSTVGVLERVRPSPLSMFEAELTIDGRSYVLLARLGARPLETGARYRSFVVRGIARMGVIVAMEEA
jgi:hypothetical protein